MAEVLFYERPVPLNRTEHKDLRMKAVPNVKFAMNAHSVPLTGVEFGVAARDLLIVFAGSSLADAGPVALLGLRQNENLFVDANGQWAPDTYIPAFVRRYELSDARWDRIARLFPQRPRPGKAGRPPCDNRSTPRRADGRR